MPILEPEKSLANNTSDSIDLHFYRRFYKNNVLVEYPGTEYKMIQPGVEEFWYDRNLYGKIDLDGDLVLLRESSLDTLWTHSRKTLYALNFVATMFNEMMAYIKNNMDVNNVPNANTIYRNMTAKTAWSGIYNDYHTYMVSLYGIFLGLSTKSGNLIGIENFDDFTRKFFAFIRDNVTGKGSPFTLSGYVSSNLVSNLSSGLIIDLHKFNASDDVIKTDIFINDINYDFYRHAASKHGFVIDKNMPWRLIANLSSDTMEEVMKLSKFDATYEPGPKNIFKKYYTKVYKLDLVFLRSYMYMFYASIVQANPTYQKNFYCSKTKKIITKQFSLNQLTDQEKDSHTTRDYWMEISYRMRLTELKHRLTEEKIRLDIKRAKSIFTYKGEQRAIDFLYKKTKKYFLNQYNEIETSMILAPMYLSDIMKKNSPKISY